MSVRISVIGCGYLGAVHAAAMAELGHDVIGVDADEAKVAALSAGNAPFFEPGLPELLAKAVSSGRLRFTSDFSAVASQQVHFLAVGTPQVAGSLKADLTYVHAAIDSLTPYLAPGDLVVGKSTVPVGTARELAVKISDTGAALAWNPEFLREGFAVADTLTPDRIVYGLPEDAATARLAKRLLDQVYEKVLASGTPLIATDYQTAELVKVAANSFLATKISFINAMAEIAEKIDADVTQLADAIGYDVRIGRKFLNAGVGFGGGCLPKDIRAFRARAAELQVGEAVAFLAEVDGINMRRRERVVQLVQDALSGDASNQKVAVLGLAFKPDSDDVRDSPALDIAVRLKTLGIDVVATDPQAIANASCRHPDLQYADTWQEAVREAAVIVVLTEWSQYRNLDPAAVKAITAGNILIDGRNCLDGVAWKAVGWKYVGLGQGRVDFS